MSFQPAKPPVSNATTQTRAPKTSRYWLFITILGAAVTALLWMRQKPSVSGRDTVVAKNEPAIAAAIPQLPATADTPPAAAKPQVSSNPAEIKDLQKRPFFKKMNYQEGPIVSMILGTDFLDTIAKHAAAAPVKTVQEFFAQLAKPAQFFTLDAGKAQTIIAAEGTRITVPAGAFVNSRGQIVTGTVQLEVREYYKYDDMITAGLTTTSNGEMLVTGGMIYTAAMHYGEQLKVASGKKIGVVIPASGFDRDMQLFLPSRAALGQSWENGTLVYERRAGSIDWEPAGQRQWTPIASRFNIRPHDGRTNVYSFTDEPYKVKSSRKGLKAWFALAANAPMSTAEAEALMKTNFRGYRDIKVKRAGTDDEYKPYFLSSTRYTVVGDSTRMTVPDAIRFGYIKPADSMAFEQKRRQDSLQDFYRQVFAGHHRSINPAFHPDDVKGQIDYSAWFAKYVADLEAEAVRLASTNAYTFELGEMGWINCDRFPYLGTPRADFIVNIPDSIPANSFNSFLVFKNMRSIYGEAYRKGSALQFRNLPTGLDVYFVAVGAHNGRVYSVIEHTKTGAGPLNISTLTQLTPREFKAEMAAITGSGAASAMK